MNAHKLVGMRLNIQDKTVKVSVGRWFAGASLDEKPSETVNLEAAYPVGSDDPAAYAAALVAGYDWGLAAADDTYFADAAGAVSLRPPTPSPIHVFNLASGAWEDPRSLEEARADKWSEMKLKRAELTALPLATPYGLVDCGEKDQINITRSVMLLQTLASMNTPGTVDFTMADNTVVVMDVDMVVAVGLLLGQRINGVRATATTLRNQINNSNLLEIASINWPLT